MPSNAGILKLKLKLNMLRVKENKRNFIQGFGPARLVGWCSVAVYLFKVSECTIVQTTHDSHSGFCLKAFYRLITEQPDVGHIILVSVAFVDL